MEGYRIFLMQDGHIRGSREFRALCDSEAITRAEELRDGWAAELWSGARVVRKFAAPQDAERIDGRHPATTPRA